MNRRTFLQASGILGLGAGLFQGFGISSSALAAVLSPRERFDGVTFAPLNATKVPQIIHIFLYGGPSELAGNLSNIVEINANSQNDYGANFSPDDDNTVVSPNNFWLGGGGEEMEDMLAAKKMSIYRTLNRVQVDTKDHGNSVMQNLFGNIDSDAPGIGTTLAYILSQNNPFNKPVDELIFPIVSFEGESRVFQAGDLSIPLSLKPISLNSNLENPYTRNPIGALNNHEEDEAALDALAKSVSDGETHFTKISEAFTRRGELAERINSLLDTDAINSQIDTYNLSAGDQPINYENNNFGRRLKAAVSLALANKETVFISLGSGGLGGWDDHSEALVEYPQRMGELMRAIKTALRHIELADAAGVPNANNIIINVHGDFGRNVNLNDSKGWDHGNNQNFYTFGGTNIRGAAALGKIVGKTKRIGTPFQNRQFTSPTDDSYQCEPFAIAASIYKYFGVQNPEKLTFSKTLYDRDMALVEQEKLTQAEVHKGFAPIDETVASETINPWTPPA